LGAKVQIIFIKVIAVINGWSEKKVEAVSKALCGFVKYFVLLRDKS